MEKSTYLRRPVGKQIKSCKHFGKSKCLEETYWRASKDM